MQFGGQTPLRLARRLIEAGVPILGTPFASIDLAEDRERFGRLLRDLGLEAPAWGMADDVEGAVRVARAVGYPVLVRPSYVLGGREMRICYDEEQLRDGKVAPGSLVDRFVEDAIEIDVDAVSDGDDVLIGAVMEHVEEAGVHSGDSACVIPPLALGETVEAEVRRQTTEIARALGVVGLVNVQYAVQDGRVYVLEANPRASRTVPFVAKATGLPLVEAAVRVALGERVRDLGLRAARAGHGVGQGGGAAVRPLHGRRRAARAGDALDGRGDGHRPGLRRPRSRRPSAPRGSRCPGSTGDRTPGVVITVNDRDKPAATLLAQRLHDLGFHIYATSGTARAIAPARDAGRGGVEGLAAGRRHDHRPDRRPARRPHRQHAARPRRARRRPGDPPGGDRGARCP